MGGIGSFRLSAPVLLLGIALAPMALAETPWAGLMSSRRVECDPNKDYPLKESNGPWTIMACSFSGEGAEKQAKDLVLELRSKYKLEAYAHKVNFKLDDPNGPNMAGAPVRWQYRRFHDRPDLYKDSAIHEIAVLVGDFPAVDDPEVQKTLKKLRSIEPDCLNLEKGKPTSRPLAALRYMQDAVKASMNPKAAETKHGPMNHAFVTTNPLLPPDYYAPKGGIDELVLRINKGVPNSLLDCPGRYTVKVATFTGTVELDQDKIRKIEDGQKQLDSSLAKAAEMAHRLTEALRIKGYEAYEFHDRCASMVTVGSFDSVGTPRPDGKTEINPQIHAIMKTFGGPPGNGLAPAGGNTVSVKSLAGIPFDFQPIPVEVPKRSISRELARRLDGE